MNLQSLKVSGEPSSNLTVRVLELGIEPEAIKKKFLAILTQRGFKDVSTYEDMAGAVFVLFLFGALLLLVSEGLLTQVWMVVKRGTY